MNRFFTAVLFVLAISLLSSSVVAQSHNHTEPLPPFPPRPAYPPLVLPDVESRSSRSHGRPTVAREDRVLKKGLLAPSSDDRRAFEGFLKTRNTGLIRLLPREVYDSSMYRVEKKLNIRGGGAYYSFADLTHAYGYGSDISLERNRLRVGFAGADYGMLASLGDVPIDAITKDDPRVQFLSSYLPPRSESAARAEGLRFSFGRGVMIEGLRYHRSLPVKENTSYLLRSIAYNRSDVLVALRVVRMDTDGSAIIVWKLLKKFPRTELARN